MKLPQAIVCVTNDLTTDQRVDRTCLTLIGTGYTVLLVGRKLPGSLPLKPRSYGLKRLHLLFHKGPLFYACYNFRLLLFLLFHRVSLIVSNDLDALPAAYLAFRIKNLFRLPGSKHNRVAMMHDCHEYFRGMPELTGRKITLRIWKWLEDMIFPKLPAVTAVNASVARLYEEEYGNSITVLRNVPLRKTGTTPIDLRQLGIGQNQKIILYQGAVNIDRGLEEAVMAMKYVKSDAVLVIAGTGDIVEKLRQLIRSEEVGNRVILTGQIPFQELHRYTVTADIGLSIEKDVSINYHFCLPNKFLDYIQAHLPVLISPFPEMQAILNHYDIGELLESHDPVRMAHQFDRMLNDPSRLAQYRPNLKQAADDLCWENEEEKLIGLIDGRRGGQADKRTGGRVLEIVSFDIPFPADYGGVIDVFYSIKALSEAGIGIRLHCFEYHRKPAKILEDMCDEVFYYPRRNSWTAQLSLLPFIVRSRKSELLLHRLLGSNHPILFEGLHTCGWLAHPGLQNRLKIYRESNIEHDYYRHLARASRSVGKKLFYLAESYRLKRFQSILAHADIMLTVSRSDQSYLQTMFPGKEIRFLPSFHKNEAVGSQPGRGSFVLYQGNLGVEENDKAALFIAGTIWNTTMPQLVIAGKSPSAALKKFCSGRTNVTLSPDPSEEVMAHLIREAHVNLMVTFQPTGLKLKLLHALFEGRFCVVNPFMLEGTDLKETCVVADTPADFRESIHNLFSRNFTEADILQRRGVLESYANKKSCKILLESVNLFSSNGI